MTPHPHLQCRIPLIYDLGFRSEALDQLQAYVELLWSSNLELNLISRKMSYEELIDNHLIDCLLPLKYFPRGLERAADFGSGGGLPGVLYALQFPDTQFHLFEKSKKKQIFLRQCQQFAPNLRIHGDIPLHLEEIQIVTARAFKPLDVLLQMSRSYYEKGGHYFLLKAREEKIREELRDSQKLFNDLQIQLTPLSSPLLEVERHLVQINPVGEQEGTL